MVSGVGCICEFIAEVVEGNGNNAKYCCGQKHLIRVKGKGCASVVDHISESDCINGHTYANEAQEYLRSDGIGNTKRGFHNDKADNVRDDIFGRYAAHRSAEALRCDIVFGITDREDSVTEEARFNDPASRCH